MVSKGKERGANTGGIIPEWFKGDKWSRLLIGHYSLNGLEPRACQPPFNPLP